MSNNVAVLLLGVLGTGVLVGCNTIPAATPEQMAPFQGTYSGEAVMGDVAMPGPVCQPRIRIVDFNVVGNEVRFGGFRGTVRQDGTVEMTMGQSWIAGQFVSPGGFAGQLLLPPTSVCRYRLTLSLGG